MQSIASLQSTRKCQLPVMPTFVVFDAVIISGFPDPGIATLLIPFSALTPACSEIIMYILCA